MNRQIIYRAAIPQDTDVLTPQINAMVSDGFIAQATVGSGTVVDGLGCSALTTGLGVVVGPGSIFTQSVVDQNNFGSIAANLNPLVKVGVNLASTTFALTAPATSGQSISYLLEAAFLEADGGSTVIPYYSAANPAQPQSGPNGGGASQNTVRAQTVQLQLKAGSPAPAGTQATPAVDVGWVPLYVLTVNAGASAPIIVTAPGAPFVGDKLPTVNTKIAAAGAAIATLKAGLAADQAAIAAIQPGTSRYAFNSSPGTTTNWTVPANVSVVKATVIGGGAGGGSNTNAIAGGGGGAGGASIAYVAVTAGQVIALTCGSGGLGGQNGNNGGAGGTSSFGTMLSATGGQPGAGAGTGQNSGGAGGQGYEQNQLAILLCGGWGTDGSATGVYGGQGGASMFGGGGRGGTVGGIAATAIGAGGGGSYGTNVAAGGGGGSGIVIVEY